jgi:hypothetical protein
MVVACSFSGVFEPMFVFFTLDRLRCGKLDFASLSVLILGHSQH